MPQEKWGTTRRLKKHIAIDEKTMPDIFKILAIFRKSFFRFLSRISVKSQDLFHLKFILADVSVV